MPSESAALGPGQGNLRCEQIITPFLTVIGSYLLDPDQHVRNSIMGEGKASAGANLAFAVFDQHEGP